MAFDGELSPAAAKVLEAVAIALEPAPEIRISDWVDEGHVYLSARTNTPKVGTFSFDGVEYLREPLDRLHPDDPCTRVTIRGGAQSAKSTVGQLWVAWSIDVNPKSFAIGLPSAGEMVKYNDLKLAPIIEDSERLAHKVRAVSTKSNEGSGSKVKRLYNGATIRLFNLASPKELQMISAGNIILEEVGNALAEVGNRGGPVKQARERQAAYSVVGSKELMVSTPAILGECEVTRAEEAGDRRRFYGRCQQCGGHFRLEPDDYKRTDRIGTPNHFLCPPAEGGCGGVLEEPDMPAFRQAGVWLPTFPSEDPEGNPAPGKFVAAADIERWRARDCEGRQPSYYIWQAYCGLISWTKISESIADAVTPADLMALEQQTYGRAFDPALEALAWEELHRLREPYDRNVVPEWAEVLTGFADVQGTWLDAGTLAWGPGGEWQVVDREILVGDTSGDEVWQRLDEYRTRVYRHAAGGELAVEAFGVDTGFRTQKAYAYCRGRAGVYAMDGRPGWKLPFLGKPTRVKVIENGRVKGRVNLWPSGTWELKALLMWSLAQSIEAGYGVRLQGRGHWSMAEDEAWAQQITAEVLAEEKDPRSNELKRWWKQVRDRNEWVDIWVGARALAYQLGVGAPRKDGKGEAIDWAARAAQRQPGATQSDLFAKSSKAAGPVAAESPETKRGAPRERRFFRKRS